MWFPLFTYFLPENLVPGACHVALEPQHDMALTQCDVAPCFGPFFAQKPSSLPQPRRVGTPTRHRPPPMRRGALFLDLFLAKTRFTASATSRWNPNKTSPSPNATWRPVLVPFSRKNQASCLNHVALDSQRDIAPLQCDVARAFGSFSARKTSSLPQPRRVGASTRHDTPPMRRGAPPSAYKKPPAGLQGARWLKVLDFEQVRCIGQR